MSCRLVGRSRCQLVPSGLVLVKAAWIRRENSSTSWLTGGSLLLDNLIIFTVLDEIEERLSASFLYQRLFRGTAPALPGLKRCYVWFDSLENNTAANCWGLATAYGDTPECRHKEFMLWNPSLAESTSVFFLNPETTATESSSWSNAYTYPCTLSVSNSYCVKLMPGITTTSTAFATPAPLPADQTTKCTLWYNPTS
ncbi:hypothetical protein GQ53DRAFT_805715 [Thozetella sp. PMI_491]|nr:hypothetical protein GQ53DRAFT_805715 [Thozetella sp. PMI_491]